MNLKKKSTRGGKREGSGAKLKYGEKTTTVSFRTPLRIVELIKATVKKILHEELQRAKRL